MVFEPQTLAPGPGTWAMATFRAAPISIRFERFPVFQAPGSAEGHDSDSIEGTIKECFERTGFRKGSRLSNFPMVSNRVFRFRRNLDGTDQKLEIRIERNKNKRSAADEGNESIFRNFWPEFSEPCLIPEKTVMSSTLERMKQLFVAKFDFKMEELKPTTKLEYLGLDSLDMVEFMFDIENEFNIKIPDQEFKVTTIQDIIDAVDRFISEQRIGSLSQN
jgi:acyl carrier protein